VLWNEQPVAGAHVYATADDNFASTHYGDAITDAHGHFFIRGVPPGQKYLYAFGTGSPYWVTAVTPVVIATDTPTAAPDTYLCRGFDLTSPEKGERIATPRPSLRWTPYPGATTYAVRIRTGANNAAFSRGDNDARLSDTNVRVDSDLAPGEYNWRVAFNRDGHIIASTSFHGWPPARPARMQWSPSGSSCERRGGPDGGRLAYCCLSLLSLVDFASFALRSVCSALYSSSLKYTTFIQACAISSTVRSPKPTH
jgi:hypothetical protein